MIDIPKDIPNKQDFPQVKKLDRQIIRAAVLLGLDNQSAFALYHAEYIDGRGKLNDAGKRECSHFWSYGKNREYRDAYEKYIEEFINGGNKNNGDESKEIDDKRKDKALKSLLSRAMSLVEGGMELDAEGLKTVSDIFKRLNLIKEDVEQEIKPLRFLPEVCSRCRMKVAVESMVLNGEMLDMCAYCKCRSIAEDNGYQFNNGKDLLDIPKEVIADLEGKNSIKLVDILDGKIEN